MTKGIRTLADFEREKTKRKPLSTFGLRLTKFRKDRGLSQIQMALFAGISRSYYSMLKASGQSTDLTDEKKKQIEMIEKLKRSTEKN